VKMTKVFCIDVGRCSGCYNCQFACKDEHCGNEWLPFAKEQPLTGQFWLRLEEHVQGTKPRVRMHYIIIDPVKSAGQRQIVDACPYGAVYWNEEANIPQKCTGCAHLLQEGRSPRCVDNCRTGALSFGDEEDFKDFIENAEVRSGGDGCGPRVYYRNIPGQFIAGLVYDPEEEAVIRNAKCVLEGNGLIREELTDIFGDFWFRDLPQGYYSLRISAEGFRPLEFEDLYTDRSINLGDMPMERCPDGKEG